MRDSSKNNEKKKSFLTFFVGNEMLGIEVLKVQEVTRDVRLVPVALAPDFICGLMNLRGQISTSLGAHELFSIKKDKEKDKVAVVCKIENNLFSIIVDSIGDVIELDINQFEKTPESIDDRIKKFLSGVYKIENRLLSIIDLDRLTAHLQDQAS